VTGAHRTGTTWVGKMLAAAPGVAYISEPLNVLHRPGVLSARTPYWYTYISAENEAEYLPGLRRTLALRYRLGAELLSLRSVKDAGRMLRDVRVFWGGRLSGALPLLKDPFAVFSAPWFARRLNCQAVITVRHPAAFASSLKRLGWHFDFSDLLAQPALMRDHLEPYRTAMEAMLRAPQDVIGQAALLWQMVYATAAKFQRDHPDFILTRHEDLSQDPEAGFEELYCRLGLDFTAQARETVLTSSSAENPGELSTRAVHAVQLDSRANLHNWKHRLTSEEIGRIRDLTAETAAYYYPDPAWD
jgi:hypothetical protein